MGSNDRNMTSAQQRVQDAKKRGKTLSEMEEDISAAEIVHRGEELVLPETMTLTQAADLLARRAEYEQQTTVFAEKFDVMPFDGAHALAQVLVNKFGWAPAVATPGFWGEQPPVLIRIEVAPGVYKEVPWGRFSLPNIEGYIETDVSMKNNRFTFQISAQILRRDERQVRSLMNDVRSFLKTGSIYQGKAIKIRFRDDDGDHLKMPEPSFIDTSKIDPNGLIYAADVQNAVETNLFTPILRVHDCIANDIPVKRGVLLSGTYGTGKTMAATTAARHATDVGVTYVYIPHADELADAIEFAKQYQSPACMIFCEDVDRVTDGERSVEMDDILNLLDGIDTKKANIITVLTTNDLEAINPAMLRPGRLDAVINVTPPDAQAVEKLIRLYAGNSLDKGVDLTEAGVALAGIIPATIAEVVKRAKLSQLRLQPIGEKVVKISQAAIVEASKTMSAQNKMLQDRIEKKEVKPTVDSTLRGLIEQVVNGDDE